MKSLSQIKQENKKINAILQFNPNFEKELKASKNKKGKLAGKVIAVKSNINVKGLNASCASKTLENYKASYDASVIEKIKSEGGVILGMCNMDEFACGSSGETSAFKPCQNPSASGLIPGGSSSGSAAAVAADFCDMALGSDTGGSIRNPASHCGVVGFKPSYGVVSRYGLIDLSMSLDQIGPMAKKVADVKLLFDVIKGKDEKDAISVELKKQNKNINQIVIGIPNLTGLKIEPKIQKLIDEKVKEICRKFGWKTKSITLKHIDLAIATYYPLVYVEFFSGTRKFDGRRYGKRIEEVAGSEVLRRILGGAEISKAEHHGRYYHSALKTKKLIEEEFSRAFKEQGVDVIIMPTVPKLPHKIGSKISIEEMYSYDALTIPANLAGNCCICMPAGKINNIPVGMQIMADKFQDDFLLNVAEKIDGL